MDLRYAAVTDVGRRRDHNEDAYDLFPDSKLFVVADGLGGYAAGEVASRLAVESIGGFIQSYREDEDITWPVGEDRSLSPIENIFVNAVYSANRRVWSAANRYSAYRGMATTIVGLMFDGDRCYLAHVGDSRCYRVRDGALERLTEDHSLLNAFRRSGAEGIDEETFAMRNVIMRALGQRETVEVDVRSDDVRPGDLFLLCTDGLTGELSDTAIMSLVEQYERDLDALTRKLVDAACEHGGRDNVTVVAVRVADAAARARQ